MMPNFNQITYHEAQLDEVNRRIEELQMRKHELESICWDLKLKNTERRE